MGYYTRHEMTIESKPELIAVFREDSVSAAYSILDDGGCYDETKWYDSDQDLKTFSAKHPKHLMILDGVGEDGVMSRTYAKNGKLQYAKVRIVYDEFDPSKLV